MTQDKARKSAARQRMAETGEPYSVARHAVEREHEGAAAEDPLSAGRDAPQRDDSWYASEAEQAGMTAAEFRMQYLAELAGKARQRAEEAEETANVAYEAAGLAQQAADLTQGWASEQEQERAQRRARQAKAAAEEAERRANQAMWQAVDAEEAADQAAADLSDEASGIPHTGPSGSYHGHGRDGTDPRFAYQFRGPAELVKLLGRFGQLMSRAMQTTNPAHSEPRNPDSR